MMGSWKNNSKSMMQKTSKLSKSVIWRENTTDIIQNNFGSPLLRLQLRNSLSVTLTPWPLLQLFHRNSCTWLLLRNSHSTTSTPKVFQVFLKSWRSCIFQGIHAILIHNWRHQFIPLILAKSCLYPCVCTHVLFHSGKHTSRGKHWYTCTNTHERTHMQRHRRTYTRAYTHTCALTNTHIGTHTHTM